MKIQLPSEEACRRICERSVALFGIFELWGEAETQEELRKQVQTYVNTHEEAARRVKERTFKFIVEGYNRHYPRALQLEMIRSFSYLKYEQKVDMRNPEEIYWLFELVRQYAPDEERPLKVYFARQIARGARHLIEEYTLKKRGYLGTTSMESEISFFTANQALARPGSLVFDPFVGTGSLVITCAALGAYTLGADIDMDVLVGKSADKNTRSNFRQYDLQSHLIDLCRFDNSRNTIWRTQRPFLDAIVCDPPYGIRAGAKKVGIRSSTIIKHEKTNTKVGPIHENPADPGWLPHVVQTIPYSVPDVLLDLFDFSARSLVMGGRLVYWLPTTSEYTESDLPQHPCFALVANSEQKLTMYFSRRLITMEKIKEYDESDRAIVPDQHLSDEPAHANIAAKVTKQAHRFDSRNETTEVPEAVTQAVKRLTGADVKRANKAKRRQATLARRAQEAAASSSNSDSNPVAEPKQENKTADENQ